MGPANNEICLWSILVQEEGTTESIIGKRYRLHLPAEYKGLQVVGSKESKLG